MALQTTCVPGLVTRGFVAGTHVTRGHGACKKKIVPIPPFVEEIQRRIRQGRSAYGRTLKDVIVTAKLMFYNERDPDPQIVGSDSVSFHEEDPRTQARAAAKLVGTEVKKASSKIVIRVAELFDPKDGQDGND